MVSGRWYPDWHAIIETSKMRCVCQPLHITKLNEDAYTRYFSNFFEEDETELEDIFLIMPRSSFSETEKAGQ